MKLKVNFGTPRLVLLGVIFLLSLGGVVFDILIFIGIPGLVSFSEPLVASSMIILLLVLAVSLLVLFLSHYTVADDYLEISFGLFSNKIPLTRIIEIKRHTINGEIYMLYTSKNKNDENQYRAVKILIDADKRDEFVKLITEKNKDIIITDFTPMTKRTK